MRSIGIRPSMGAVAFLTPGVSWAVCTLVLRWEWEGTAEASPYCETRVAPHSCS